MAAVLQGDLTAVSYFTGRNPAYAILGDLIQLPAILLVWWRLLLTL